MNMGKLSRGQKAVLLISLVVIGLVAAFFAFNSYIYNQKQIGTEPASYSATLTGEYVCLPHKDTTGPQTLECALGIKTDVGEYYGLDFNLLSQVQGELATGDRITVTGVITPVEMLSSDHWQKYPIEGILTVSDSVEVIR